MRHTSGFDISKMSFTKRSEDMYTNNLLKHKVMKFHKQSSNIINSMVPEPKDQNEYFDLKLSMQKTQSPSRQKMESHRA